MPAGSTGCKEKKKSAPLSELNTTDQSFTQSFTKFFVKEPILFPDDIFRTWACEIYLVHVKHYICNFRLNLSCIKIEVPHTSAAHFFTTALFGFMTDIFLSDISVYSAFLHLPWFIAKIHLKHIVQKTGKG